MKTEDSSSWQLALGCVLIGALAGGCALSSGIDLPNTDRGDTGSASDGGAEAPSVGGEDDGSGGDCGFGGAGGATDEDPSDDCR